MKPRLIMGLVLALSALAYWPGLAGPLVLDDRANLEPLVQWLHDQAGWHSIVFGNASGLFGRPVSMASFLLNAATTGESVYAFKLTNLILHLGNGIAVYALFDVLLRRRMLTADSPAAAQWLPLLGAAFWVLHPLLVSTVLYVVQRMAMLSALFMLLTMLAYLHGRIALEDGRRAKAGWLLGIAAPLFTVLAALSKENGVLAPALCGLIEWLVFMPSSGHRRRTASTGFVLLVLAMPALVAVALTVAGDHHIVGGYQNRGFTLTQRLLTQPRVLWHYVGAMLLPYGPRLGLYHDDFPISHSLLSPPTTLVAIAGWLLALGSAWRLRSTIPALALGLGIFLVGQALESTVFPLLMYFEHRVYLPSIGLAWALLGVVSFVGTALARRMHHARGVFTGAAVTIVLAIGLATAARAAVWRTQQGILVQALATHPNSRWIRMDVIAWNMAKTPPDVAAALRHADRLMAMPDPLDQRFGALMRLSIECIDGKAASAARIGQVFGGRLESIEPDLLVGYEAFAERIIKEPCTGLGPRQMGDALVAMLGRSTLPARHRSIWRLRFKAARLYLVAGRPDDALVQAKLAWAGGAADGPVPLMIAALLLQRGNDLQAATWLDRAQSRIRPDDATGERLVAEYRAELARRSH